MTGFPPARPGACTIRVGERGAGPRRACALSLAFGLLLAREIIVGGGLLSAAPVWTAK
jgi:hypothetical protein